MGQVTQANRPAPKAGRQALRPLHRAVCDGDRERTLRGEVGRRQIDHLARPDEQDVCLVECRENSRRQPHAGGGHRYRLGADRGAAADFFGDGERALKQLVQIGAHRAGVFGALGRVLHLTEDLRFAQHHRVEAGGNPKCMAHGLILIERVEVRGQHGRINAVILREPSGSVAQRPGVVAGAINFGAVASGQNRRFARQPLVQKLAQRGMQALDLKYHLLAQLQRRGVVVDAEGG